jgi:hypothetical protein
MRDTPLLPVCMTPFQLAALSCHHSPTNETMFSMQTFWGVKGIFARDGEDRVRRLLALLLNCTRARNNSTASLIDPMTVGRFSI